MADQNHQDNENLNTTKPPEETKDRGLFNFFDKKEEEKPQEEKPQDEAVMADHGEEHKPTLMEKLHRTKSSSSSSSEEEVEEGGVKIRRKKKKGLKGKISSDKEEEIAKSEVHGIPGEHYTEPIQPAGEEKKGLLEKLKEKMSGHHKDGGQPPVAHTECHGEDEAKEKKGILEKIKEKLHKDGEEAKKEH